MSCPSACTENTSRQRRQNSGEFCFTYRSLRVSTPNEASYGRLLVLTACSYGQRYARCQRCASAANRARSYPAWQHCGRWFHILVFVSFLQRPVHGSATTFFPFSPTSSRSVPPVVTAAAATGIAETKHTTVNHSSILTSAFINFGFHQNAADKAATATTSATSKCFFNGQLSRWCACCTGFVAEQQQHGQQSCPYRRLA